MTYAKQDEAGVDDVPGPGHGLIDILDPEQGVFYRFVTGSDAGGKFQKIDSPWGITLSPASFGGHGDELLVGNFGDGTINAYDTASGEFLGTLQGANGRPIVNPGLWALQFGNGAAGGDSNALYFTAGISGPAGDAIETARGMVNVALALLRVCRLGRRAPLELEIGSGKGLFLRTAAAAHPERDYLGVEIAYRYARFAAAGLLPALKRVAEILKKAGDDIEQVWQSTTV